jgi:predicted DNA-binding transcriptional regulator AlpA
MLRGMRAKTVKRMASPPDFITRMELAHNLGCAGKTIDYWVRQGTMPPPHFSPGVRYSVWLRSDYQVFLKTGRWPEESFRRGMG